MARDLLIGLLGLAIVCWWSARLVWREERPAPSPDAGSRSRHPSARGPREPMPYGWRCTNCPAFGYAPTESAAAFGREWHMCKEHGA